MEENILKHSLLIAYTVHIIQMERQWYRFEPLKEEKLGNQEMKI